MCIDTDTDIEIYIYLSIHLKLGKAYRVIEAVIEAEKSQDMQSARLSWRPRTAKCCSNLSLKA